MYSYNKQPWGMFNSSAEKFGLVFFREAGASFSLHMQAVP